MKFNIHNIETASEQSKPLLEKSLNGFGMIPTLHGVLAESPAALEAYQELTRLFTQTSLDKEEITVVWQTINSEHDCHYCVPAHFAVAHSMGVDGSVIDALKNKTDLPSEKLKVLKETTLTLVRNRGRINSEDVEKFTQVGYAQQQLIEIVLGISHKVISNYVNHFSETPLDEPFKQFA